MSKVPFEDEIRRGDVRRDWDSVLPGLLKVKAYGAHWRPEDIYAMCRAGDAGLYLFDGGFAICGLRENGYTLEVDLHMYAVYSEREDSCMKFLPYFKELARNAGATSMTMESSRKVFERYGWDIDYHVFKRSL